MDMASKAYADWVADGSPWKYARPIRALGDQLAAHGYTVYFQGNLEHLTKATPEDHCPFSATGWPGRSPYPYCLATDIMPPVAGQTSKLTGMLLPSLAELAKQLNDDKTAGFVPAMFVKYMNSEPNGPGRGCFHDAWQPSHTRTASGDTGHIHVSCRTDYYLSAATDGYDLVARTRGDVPVVITEGVDYSFARPSPTGLKNAGKKFAVRYGGMGGTGKWLTAGELAALRLVGLDVVANVEGAAGGYKGTAAGRAWATAGESHFRNLGMGADRPIYFSVDWDAGASDWATIDAALRASAAVLGADRVGVYGSYDTIAHCASAGTATWFWQTYAWSAGRQHPKAHLYQYKNGVTVGGGDCDLTRGLTADFGQWNATTNGVDDMAFSEAQMRAFPWQYVGGGIPVGMSMLAVVNEVLLSSRAQALRDAALLVAVRDHADKDEILARVDERAAELAAEVGQVDDEVWANVPDPGVSATEKAALLAAVLGDDAAAVGRILAGLTGSATP
jgi:glycoside hydrolase-like protein